MDFKEAASTKLPFGKYDDKSIDNIAKTNAGLRYLDWLRGEREGRQRKKHAQPQRIDEALRVYLDDPTIQRELSMLADEWDAEDD